MLADVFGDRERVALRDVLSLLEARRSCLKIGHPQFQNIVNIFADICHLNLNGDLFFWDETVPDAARTCQCSATQVPTAICILGFFAACMLMGMQDTNSSWSFNILWIVRLHHDLRTFEPVSKFDCLRYNSSMGWKHSSQVWFLWLFLSGELGCCLRALCVSLVRSSRMHSAITLHLHIATQCMGCSPRSVFFILGTFCVIFLQEYTGHEQKKSCDPMDFDDNWVFFLKDAGLGQLYDNFAWERCTQETLKHPTLKETLAFLPVTGSHLSGIQSFLASPQQCLGCLVFAQALQTLV